MPINVILELVIKKTIILQTVVQSLDVGNF